MKKKKKSKIGDNIIPKFTEWQIEIIRQWAKNKSAALAAQKLNISEHTLQTHLKRMRRKLGVHRTFEVYLHMNQCNHLGDKTPTS